MSDDNWLDIYIQQHEAEQRKLDTRRDEQTRQNAITAYCHSQYDALKNGTIEREAAIIHVRAVLEEHHSYVYPGEALPRGRESYRLGYDCWFCGENNPNSAGHCVVCGAPKSDPATKSGWQFWR